MNIYKVCRHRHCEVWGGEVWDPTIDFLTLLFSTERTCKANRIKSIWFMVGVWLSSVKWSAVDVPLSQAHFGCVGHFYLILWPKLPASIGHQTDRKRIVPWSRYKSGSASSSARSSPWPGRSAPRRSRAAWRSDRQGSSCAANKRLISGYLFSLYFSFYLW